MREVRNTIDFVRAIEYFRRKMSLLRVFLVGLFALFVLGFAFASRAQERRGVQREAPTGVHERGEANKRGSDEPRRPRFDPGQRERPRSVFVHPRMRRGPAFARPPVIVAQPDQRAGRRVAPGRGDYRRVFTSVQEGISSGSVGPFSQHMAQQVYVNLRGGESGYYSANEAYYLLENYFKSRRPVKFNFSTVGESESNPYATGSVGFNLKGSRVYAQVYVSLSFVGNRWVISQINIY